MNMINMDKHTGGKQPGPQVVFKKWPAAQAQAHNTENYMT